MSRSGAGPWAGIWRLLAGLVLLAVLSALGPGGALLFVGSSGRAADRMVPVGDEAVSFDSSRPLTVVVRGWLWDPESRARPAPFGFGSFASGANEVLRADHGIHGRFVDYRWSRIPVDLPGANEEFLAYARSVAKRAERAGRCVNFIGHSAGAAMVYNAAARGVRMGYMGTLGLPTGVAKPSSVTEWANFYTTTHERDLPGLLWAGGMRADINFDLAMPHRDFWSSGTVVRTTADGIARSWQHCRPSAGAAPGAA